MASGRQSIVKDWDSLTGLFREACQGFEKTQDFEGCRILGAGHLKDKRHRPLVFTAP
jgi:hypothetical protein